MNGCFGSIVLLLLSTGSGDAFATSRIRQPTAWFAQLARCSSKASGTVMQGSILDDINSNNYDLLSSSQKNDDDLSNAYEIFLAELVFSTNDPRVDIMNRIELASDPEFLDWLDKKCKNSKDPEERIALRDLYEMIDDIKTRVEVNKLAEERAAAEKLEAERAAQAAAQAEANKDTGNDVSTAEILNKATAIQTATNVDARTEGQKATKKEKVSFYDQDLTPEIRTSYESLLKKVLPPYKPGESPTSIVYNNYNQFDAQFVKVLTERSTNGDVDAAALLQALAVEQKKRIEMATETLKTILAAGDPMRMEGAVVKLAREGKIDEAFLLLVEANENQARQAGATGPASLMGRLRQRAIEEKDRQAASKEIRLLRRLLRTKDAGEREKIIEDAFTPREGLLVSGSVENAQRAVDGGLPEQSKPMPEVAPPDFINACKAVLLNFGNLGSDMSTINEDGEEHTDDLASRIRQLAAEAEVVATRIYGQGMTVREQQDRMWKEQTTSIFDLEKMELEAERRGERAPWTNPDAGDDILLPGFDRDGRMQVGGQ